VYRVEQNNPVRSIGLEKSLYSESSSFFLMMALMTLSPSTLWWTHTGKYWAGFPNPGSGRPAADTRLSRAVSGIQFVSNRRVHKKEIKEQKIFVYFCKKPRH